MSNPYINSIFDRKINNDSFMNFQIDAATTANMMASP